MTARFKHRLLGTSILVMAGIIFLPDLLDGEKHVTKDDFQVIPDRPEFQGVQPLEPFDENAFATALAEAAATSDAASETSTAEVSEPIEANALPSQNYAQVTVGAVSDAATTVSTEQVARPVTTPNASQAAWVVRVGSFGNSQNANALVLKLRDAGFTTFTRSITNSAGQQLTSVFVGPEIKRDRLEQGLPKLQQLTGIERLTISHYQPTENN